MRLNFPRNPCSLPSSHCPVFRAHTAEPAPREPYGIGLEGFTYPYPVNHVAAGQ